MTKKTWWTVSGAYDDGGEPFLKFVEALDPAAARKKALKDADAVVIGTVVFAGRLYPADTPSDDVIPIRGKDHAISVSHVHVTEHKLIVPNRCSKCKQDLKRAGALLETWLAPRSWSCHLAHNGKDLSGEKDGNLIEGGVTLVETVRIRCAACKHDIWNGVDNG